MLYYTTGTGIILIKAMLYLTGPNGATGLNKITEVNCKFSLNGSALRSTTVDSGGKGGVGLTLLGISIFMHMGVGIA